jgi:hypothetical protein
MSIKPDKLKNINKVYRSVGPYIGLGMQLAVTVVAMMFLGIWLDGIFNLEPVLTLRVCLNLINEDC